MIIGAEFRKHRSVHWGSVQYAAGLPVGLPEDFRVYYFNGGQDIINGFVQESYELNNNWNFLGELQLAYHKYRFYNERYLNHDFSVNGLYLNPRLGINYKFDPFQNIYFSFARVTREPRLSTYYSGEEAIWGAVPQFEQNPDGSYNYNKPYVNPETMNDFELGYSVIRKSYNITLNLYYMLFNNEIVQNGKLDIFGQPITGNFKSTVHKGIEFSGVFKPLEEFEIYANATYSRNTITDGTTYLDDNGTSIKLYLDGSTLGGFPDFLANIGVSCKFKGIYLKLNGKYVGKFYSDNYGKHLSGYLRDFPGLISYTDNVNDAYFTADFFASYELKELNVLSASKIFIQINNIFDNLYSANAIGEEFFPAAGRNFLMGVQIGL